jgi:3-dehydroquinate dehydratase type II
MQRILVLNGPNLDLLGVREPEIYGTTTLRQLEELVQDWGTELGLEVETFQSNHEGALIDRIHDARTMDGLVINAAALTHTSRGLQDALTAVELPAVEVHISNIKEREAFRRVSLLSPPAVHTIYGRGLAGYRWALRHLVHRSAMPFERTPYGALPDQFGDLRLPEGDGRHLVVVVHGGLWKHEWTHDTIEGIAVDLTRRGYVTWNLEYRRVGLGGGWPESFDDVAAAVAAAPKLTGIEAKNIVVLGHSAGGAMALWAGGLGKDLVPGLVVGLAAMPDLVRAEEEGIGQGSVRKLLGRTRPDPSEYSPLHRLPTGTDTVIAVADGDELVPISHGKDYAAAASAAGDSIEFIEIPGLHSSFLGPETAAWKDVAGAVSSRLSAPNPGPPQI